MPIRQTRRRYLAFKLMSDGDPTPKQIESTIVQAVLSLYGEQGVFLTQLRLVEYDPANRLGVVRCGHTSVDRVRAAMSCIIEVDGLPAALTTIGVSGTLKALRRKFLSKQSYVEPYHSFPGG